MYSGKKEGKRSRKVRDAKYFEESRMEELRRLLENGTFSSVPKSDVPEGARMFGFRFIDQLKRADKGMRTKSRLGSQKESDHEASKTATKAPTVKSFSKKLLFSNAASILDIKKFSRAVTKTDVPSETTL